MEMLFLAMLIGGLGLVSWAAGAKTPARAPRVLAAAERTHPEAFPARMHSPLPMYHLPL